MLQSFAAKDDRVVVIEKENGGLSSARNLGLEKARGEWVIFTDPDDRVDSYYLESLLSTVDGTDNILGIGGFRQYYESQKITVDHLIDESNNHAQLKDYFPKWDDNVIGVVWNKIYKTSSLREKGFQFKNLWPEDLYFNLELYPYIDSFGISRNCGYKYLMHANTMISRYHDNFKSLIAELKKKNFSILRKCGVSEEELAKRSDSVVAFDVYRLVLNIYNRSTPYSFSEKVRYILEELMGDKQLMDQLRNHDSSKDKRIVKITTRMMLSCNASFVAWTFRVLYALKNNLQTLYFWYDAHLSGKFSKG